MIRFSSITLLLLMIFFISNCDDQSGSTDTTVIKLTLEQSGNVVPEITLPKIHYKYADASPFKPVQSSGNQFVFNIPLDSSTVATLKIQERTAPVYLQLSADTLRFTASRFYFPQNISADHYQGSWTSQLNRWLSYQKNSSDSLNSLREIWLESGTTEYTDFLKTRYDSAQTILQNSPFYVLSYSHLGEWLVRRIETLNRANIPLSEQADYRTRILDDARSSDLFTIEKLWWQRAGSRDFTYYWAHSFGVGDSLENTFDQDLNQYDINRLGIDRFSKLKMDVINQITDTKGRAFSEMYLTAEIIGEGPFSEATEYYQSYQNSYKGQFPEFSNFLSSFYDRMERVQPGEPAFDFSYPDSDGNMVSLSDFKGKLVFLDLWASWCSPCFEEFPYMRDLQEKFSNEDFVMIGIGLDEEKSTWEYTLSQNELPWIQLYGGGELENDLFRKYQAGGVPFVVLIDEEGNILRYNDVRPSFNLEEVVRKYLEK
jgi:peroxiredoxin